MSYSYYCTKCGRRLSQESVLYDMQYLLTEGENIHFKTLRFRLTHEELRRFFVGEGDEQRYYPAEISFTAFRDLLANPVNMHNDALKDLELSDIIDFLEQDQKELEQQEHKDIFGGFMGDFSQEDTETPSPEFHEEQTPPAIQALLGSVVNAMSSDDAKREIRQELSYVLRAFQKKELLQCRIKPILEICDDGVSEILVGYTVKYLSNGLVRDYQARICPTCGELVFEKAGTAEHRSIAFVGYQSSGKTSTILALTHYALNAIAGSFGSEIWKDAAPIPGIDISLLSPSPRLREDLESYSLGYAPPKTQAAVRDDAYSATFLIQREDSNKKQILTLIDLPGELCVGGEGKNAVSGTLETNKINNQFQIAMTCDVYIACFDTAALESAAEGMASRAADVCSWVEKFQWMRCAYLGIKDPVPVMLLYTKCAELEKNGIEIISSKDFRNVRYLFESEQAHIENVPIFHFPLQRFQSLTLMRSAYVAALRCSPYGYDAPSKLAAREQNIPVQLPVPYHIDSLMRWLLILIGAVPVNAQKYRFYGGEAVGTLDNYYLERPQFRREPPADNDEAVARFYLFLNPGSQDTRRVEQLWDTPLQRLHDLLFGKRRKNNLISR